MADATEKMKIETTCSGCTEDVTLDLPHGTATVIVDNREYVASVWGDETLWMWDCPAPMCYYADSFDPFFDNERGY